MSFSINFANGSFYMSTVDGRRDIRDSKLVVEITWLPLDISRPRVGDFPGLPSESLGKPPRVRLATGIDRAQHRLA
jgi:hypothetical protein